MPGRFASLMTSICGLHGPEEVEDKRPGALVHAPGMAFLGSSQSSEIVLGAPSGPGSYRLAYVLLKVSGIMFGSLRCVPMAIFQHVQPQVVPRVTSSSTRIRPWKCPSRQAPSRASHASGWTKRTKRGKAIDWREGLWT